MSNELEGIDRWPDDELLRAAHSGNHEAFEVFCTRSLPSLRRFLRWQCQELGVSNDLVSDFANEVMIRALRQARSSADQQQPLPRISIQWLFRIANNLVVDWVRRNSRQAEVYRRKAEKMRAEAPSIDEQDRLDEVLDGFNLLNQHQREILERVLIDGMSVEEAGMEMGLKKWAARKRYQRAYQTLRDFIREHGSVSRDA